MHSEPPRAAPKKLKLRGPREDRSERAKERRELSKTVADAMPFWPPWRIRRFMRLTMRAAEMVATENSGAIDAKGRPISPRSRAETNRTNVETVRSLMGMVQDAQNHPMRKLAEKLREGERTTVQILVGQRATSPAMKMLVGAEKQVVEVTESTEESTTEADQLPASDRHR